MPDSNSSSSSYKPATWSGTAQIYIQVPATGNQYVFDCYHTITINTELKKTEHPVQTGGNISDHAFLKPPVITMDIGMSDAGKGFSTDMWSGQSTSKSVNAYNVLAALQTNRNFVNFTCKLGTFNNLLVARAAPIESKRTIAGLRATVILDGTFLASVTAQTVSARPSATSTVSQGSQNTIPVSSTLQTNYTAPSTMIDGASKNAYTNTAASTQTSFTGAVTSSSTSLYKTGTATAQ